MGMQFISDYLITIGSDFASNTITLGDKDEVTVHTQIWDLAGHDMYQSLNSLFYKGTDAILLVYDVTSRESFENALKWVEDCMEHAFGTVKVIAVIGNKIDLKDSIQVSEEEGQHFSEQLAKMYEIPCFHILTSAKTGENIEELFMKVSLLLIPENVRTMLITQYSGLNNLQSNVFIPEKTEKNLEQPFKKSPVETSSIPTHDPSHEPSITGSLSSDLSKDLKPLFSQARQVIEKGEKLFSEQNETMMGILEELYRISMNIESILKSVDELKTDMSHLKSEVSTLKKQHLELQKQIKPPKRKVNVQKEELEFLDEL